MTLPLAAAADPKPRLLCFDMDGTLIRADGTISARTIRTIHALLERGVMVTLATGRPYFGALRYIDELKLSGPALFYAGAAIVDLKLRRPLLERTLDKEIARAILGAIREERLYCELYTFDRYFTEKITELAKIHASYLHKLPAERDLFETLESEQILKIVFTSTSDEEEKRLRAIVERFKGEADFGIATGAAHPDILFANALNPTATRTSGFAHLTRILGVSAAEVASFGDGESDIPFMKLSKIGVAMGNAPDVTKAAAHLVTSSVEEDGVVAALEEIFGESFN